MEHNFCLFSFGHLWQLVFVILRYPFVWKYFDFSWLSVQQEFSSVFKSKDCSVLKAPSGEEFLFCVCFFG